MKIFGLNLFEPERIPPLRESAQQRLNELERLQLKLEMDRIDSMMSCAANQAKIEYLNKYLGDRVRDVSSVEFFRK